MLIPKIAASQQLSRAGQLQLVRAVKQKKRKICLHFPTLWESSDHSVGGSLWPATFLTAGGPELRQTPESPDRKGTCLFEGFSGKARAG